jgi:hypothetical protein
MEKVKTPTAEMKEEARLKLENRKEELKSKRRRERI